MRDRAPVVESTTSSMAGKPSAAPRNAHAAKRADACAAHSPGPHDPQPGYGLAGGEALAPHHPQPDERAGAAEARAAVHGDGAVDGVAGGHEALHHVVGRHLRTRRARSSARARARCCLAHTPFADAFTTRP